jgi:hypothetical protein
VTHAAELEELMGQIARAFAPALEAYRSVAANSSASGETMVERRFFEGEAEDRAKEEMFFAFDRVKVEDLIAVERLNTILPSHLAKVKAGIAKAAQ